MNGFVFRVLAAPIVALVLAASASSQVDEKWKRSHDHQNRYEGLIDVPVGKPDLEVLSFLGYRERVIGYPDLTVGFFLARPGTVSISAVELLENRQYFMQAKDQNWKPGAWNEFRPWPTKEVLGRENIPMENVGVVIRVDSPGSEATEFAPAFLYSTKAADAAHRYDMYLRSHIPLKSVEFRWFRVVGGEEKLIGSSRVGEQMAKAPFVLRLGLENVPEGEVVLSIEGKFKNQEGGPRKKYTFYHRPAAP